MRKNDPMKERRDALDLAIAGLETMRQKTQQYIGNGWGEERIVKINRAIQILTAMKDEGPLL